MDKNEKENLFESLNKYQFFNFIGNIFYSHNQLILFNFSKFPFTIIAKLLIASAIFHKVVNSAFGF